MHYCLTAQIVKKDSIQLFITKSDSLVTINSRQAIKYAEKAYEIAVAERDSFYIVNSALELANLYKNIALMDTAKFYIYNALEIAKKSKDFANLIKAYIAIGELNRAMYHSEVADEYIRSALNISFEKGILNDLAYAYNRMAAIYFEKFYNKKLLADSNYFYRAINYVDSSFYYAKMFNDSTFDISNYNILGACYSSLNDFDKSNYYLFLALEKAQKNNIRDELSIIYKNIGTNYLKNKQFKKSIEFGKKGALLADKLELQELAYFSYKLIYEAYYQSGNYKKALEYHSKVDSINEISLIKNSDRKLKEFQAEYETRERGLLLKNQTQLIENQRKILLSFSLALLVTLISGMFIFRQSKKLRKMNVELIEKNKKISQLMSFQQDMTSMLVHDLKNPLDVIININQDNSPEKQLLKVKNIGRQMVHMVLNILDVNRCEETSLSLNKTKFSLYSVIQEGIEDVEFIAAKKNIHIIKKIDSDYLMRADRELVKRIMVNLLTNAIKFSNFDGKIDIKVSHSGAGFITISVTDYGVGIKKDKLKTIFDKYTQINPQKSGSIVSSGLGLTFCKLAVEAHGGVIEAKSEAAKKTVIQFTLPFVEEKEFKETHDKAHDLLLSLKELDYLNPFIEKYKQISIYDVVALRELTAEIDAGFSENIKTAKIIIEKIIYNCDEISYDKLINKQLFKKNDDKA